MYSYKLFSNRYLLLKYLRNIFSLPRASILSQSLPSHNLPLIYHYDFSTKFLQGNALYQL